MTIAREQEVLITGIGSLPHPNPDSALDYAFRHTLPFLPQMPRRSRWEFMVPQALEGLPGLRVDSDGSPSIELDSWRQGFSSFQGHLQNHLALLAAPPGSSPTASPGGIPSSISVFEPSPESSVCWRPFLWELNERRSARAKIQLCGPVTAELTLASAQGASPSQKVPELSGQITQLIYLRAVAMIRRLRAEFPNREVFIFLDEPALCAVNPSQPRDLAHLASLKVLVQALKKEASWVGIHCCSDGPWEALFRLEPDYLSLDGRQSLSSAIQVLAPPSQFAVEAATLSPLRCALGLWPTTTPKASLATLGPHEIEHSLQPLELLPPSRLLNRPLHTGPCLLSAACGLGLLDPEFAENTLEGLNRFTAQRSARSPDFDRLY